MQRDVIRAFRIWRERRAILALTLRLTRATGQLTPVTVAAEMRSVATEAATDAINRSSSQPLPPPGESS